MSIQHTDCQCRGCSLFLDVLPFGGDPAGDGPREFNWVTVTVDLVTCADLQSLAFYVDYDESLVNFIQGSQY